MSAATENSPPETPHTMTTSDLMDRMFELRDESREFEDQVKELKREYDRLASILLTKMQEQGTTRAANASGTAIHVKQMVYQVKDWAAVEEFVKEEDAMHLFQRRLSMKACDEYFKAGQEIPGTVPFEKETINLRSAR